MGIAEILGMPSVKKMKQKMNKPDDEEEEPEEKPGAKGTIRARELQCIIRQKLERAIADPAHLRDIFSRFDRDGSGVLTYDDVSAACDGFGLIISPEDKSDIFEKLDPGKRGFLTYNDFINHVALVPHDIVDLTSFVDQVLSFSLAGPTLSSVPMSGVPMGEPEPNPRPKHSPTFDAGLTSVKPGEPHFSINSTRPTSRRPNQTVTPFADARRTRSAASHRRPSTAPQQEHRLPNAMPRSVRSSGSVP